MTIPIDREAILPRISGMRQNIAKLEELRGRGLEAFLQRGETFDLAQHHLRLALEGVFHIAAHVLARLPGGRATEYSEMGLKLGELGVVDRAFAEEHLVPMGKMRNILVHHYADIDPNRLFRVLSDHLNDFETFFRAIGDLLEHPEKFGLTVE